MPDLPEDIRTADPIIRQLIGTATVPSWLTGCWQRERIQFSDGRVDTQTRVTWLQLPSAYADLRIPATRMDFAGRRAFNDFSNEELLILCAQQASCGTTVVDRNREGTAARWQRSLGYQPIIDFPEPGLLSRHAPDVIIEQAPSGAYEETWRLLPGCDGLAAVLQSSGDGPATLLYVFGEHAVRVRPRTTPAPRAAPLLDLARECGSDRGRIIALLDCEFSLALRDTTSGDYIIRLSTLPFMEGTVLGIDWLGDAEPDHERIHDRVGGRGWIVKEWSTVGAPHP